MGNSISDIFSAQGEEETTQFLGNMFSYLEQNPQHYPAMRSYLIESDEIAPDQLPEQMTPEQIGRAAALLRVQNGESGGVGDALAQMGRGTDTELAHVNPQESELLKAAGGSGTINPNTGMREYLKIGGIKIGGGAVLGTVVGFAVGGPIGAAIGGGYGATVDTQKESAKDALNESARQADMANEAEKNRIALAEAEAAKVREAEARRQANIVAGQGEISTLFGKFDDSFYNNRSQSYLNYAMPTLDKQYKDQQRSLTSALARSGNLNSSIRGELFSKLQRQYDTSKLAISDQANAYAAQARAQVAQAKANLIEKNANLADPGLIRSMAEAQAQGVGVDPQYASLGQLISDLSASIPSSSGASQKSTGAGIGLYGANSESGRVVS